MFQSTTSTGLRPEPHHELSGFSLKLSYRAALGRARVAASWEDRLDALTTAERLRHRILAAKGLYRLSPVDYSKAAVCASASKQAVRRVFSLDGRSNAPFGLAMRERLARLRAATAPAELAVAA